MHIKSVSPTLSSVCEERARPSGLQFFVAPHPNPIPTEEEEEDALLETYTFLQHSRETPIF